MALYRFVKIAAAVSSQELSMARIKPQILHKGI
jgi:hypothetical protein